MQEFLQAAATDTLGWAAGMLTMGVFVVGSPYAVGVALLPVIVSINVARRLMGLPQLGEGGA